MLPVGAVCVDGGIIVPPLGGMVVFVDGVVVVLQGLPFCVAACAPGLFEFIGAALVFAGVFGLTGGAVVFGVVEFTELFVPVVAPLVPDAAEVLVGVLLVQFDGIVVVECGVVVVVVVVVGGFGGGLVVCARTGAVSPAAKLAAEANPRILAPKVMRPNSPSRQGFQMPNLR
jgi:hypothetical protein